MKLNVVLVEPEIPQNTGNIARTCAATGGKLHLVHPLGFSISEKAVQRAGLDYWDKLEIEEHDSFERFLEKYKPEENNMYFVTIPPKTLCGMKTSAPEGLVYTELILKKENTMNANVKTNEVFALKDLISYEEGSIANMDVASNPSMKYVLMAFDEGTGLTPHRAPGNAIVFALEGKATIGYEGIDYEISAGECFRFEKNGLHSVTANGRFKMALLLVLE